MASSTKSAGKAAPATSGAGATRKPRPDPSVQRFSVTVHDPEGFFSPADFARGSVRGMAAAASTLTQAQRLALGSDPMQRHAAVLEVRRFMAAAGAAMLADCKDPQRKDSRQYAGNKALSLLADLVVTALPRVDLQAWLAVLTQDTKADADWYDRARAQERAEAGQ